MYGIIQIQLKEPIDPIRADLTRFMGLDTNVNDAIRQGNVSRDPFIDNKILYAKQLHNAVYLFSEPDLYTLQVRIELSLYKTNLKLPLTNTQEAFDLVKSFTKHRKIELAKASASIWSDGDAVLRGELLPFMKRLKNTLPSIPLGIFLTVSTILHALFFPSETALSTKTSLVYNLAFTILSLLIWMIAKAGLNKNEIDFKKS